MAWAGAILEDVAVVDGATIQAAVMEDAPQEVAGTPGETVQRVTLLLPDGSRLSPPTRVLVRGAEVRVLGTQTPPWPGAPSLVACERVNLDLPDALSVVDPGTRTLDQETGRYAATAATLWSGYGHVSSGTPATVNTEGESAPLDRVTIALPLGASYSAGLEVHVSESRTPGLSGAVFRLSGEVLDSTAAVRRVIGYRPGS